MKKSMKKSKKGFTLIELVVVIAILGILAAILVPVISGFIETANQSTDNANARLVYQAAAMYIAANPDAVTADLTGTNLQPFLGSSTLPSIKSNAFGKGTVMSLSIVADADGFDQIIVTAGTGITYDPTTGKLS